ncbi:MAG: arginase [Chitinophagaceae bacterium]|nr:MAG: arginase [Chitinophagaceae bacterium]
MHDLTDFLDPLQVDMLMDDGGLTDGQIGKHIAVHDSGIPSLESIDIVLIGIPENRGERPDNNAQNSPDLIRKQFYALHYWHEDVTLADLGNIKAGASLADTYAAVKTVLAEMLRLNKTVVLLGGSHDLTLAQYEAYKLLEETVDVTCVDATIDLHGESAIRSENFLLDMLTVEPNLVKHYNHIAFQSYLLHPRMIETMDKLRFDCYRVGVVQDKLEEMEPVMRNTNMLSFDISAIRNSDSPASRMSPNGLFGTEACTLVRYAGMSNNLSSIGIYGYHPSLDRDDLSAKQIAQMLWYFIDGKNKSNQEAQLNDRDQFNEFHTVFAEVDTLFLQSKKTTRWWMQMPDRKFIACSQNDYVQASNNQIPERWLRVQERGF